MNVSKSTEVMGIGLELRKANTDICKGSIQLANPTCLGTGHHGAVGFVVDILARG
jgi:hypothetical protein